MENLAKAIINVIKSIKGVEKNLTVGEGRNSYKGVSDQDVKNIIGKAMADNGLCMLPISVTPKVHIERWDTTDYNGKPTVKQQVFTEASTKYLLLHESGESMEIEGYGHGVDSQDKSAGKATTYAMKYAMLYTFLVPTGEIDDADKTHSDNIQTPPAPKPKATPKPEAKPELKPGTDNWTEAAKWLASQDGLVFDHIDKIKQKYTISADNEQQLSGDASLIRAKGEHKAEIPLEVIDAVNAATDLPTLTKIYNDCTGLHHLREFTELFSKRKKEIALPSKNKAA